MALNSAFVVDLATVFWLLALVMSKSSIVIKNLKSRVGYRENRALNNAGSLPISLTCCNNPIVE